MRKIKEDESHFGFTMTNSGLIINLERPYLAASPDGLFNCQCHGDAVIEVKCPFKHRDRLIKDAAIEDRQFCLQVNCDGNLHLVREHPYFYQIQLQLHVCNIPICHFIVYTSIDLVYITVSLDETFVQKIVPQYKLFILNVVIPEMAGKCYTKKNGSKSADQTASQMSLAQSTAIASSDDRLYITCFCNESKLNCQIVVCCDPDCRVKSYHRDCLMAQDKKRFSENWRLGE